MRALMRSVCWTTNAMANASGQMRYASIAFDRSRTLMAFNFSHLIIWMEMCVCVCVWTSVSHILTGTNDGQWITNAHIRLSGATCGETQCDNFRSMLINWTVCCALLCKLTRLSRGKKLPVPPIRADAAAPYMWRTASANEKFIFIQMWNA